MSTAARTAGAGTATGDGSLRTYAGAEPDQRTARSGQRIRHARTGAPRASRMAPDGSAGAGTPSTALKGSCRAAEEPQQASHCYA
jgi:hypothetical protein